MYVSTTEIKPSGAGGTVCPRPQGTPVSPVPPAPTKPARRLIDPEDVRRLAGLGLTAKRIGAQIGFDTHSIRGVTRRHGIPIAASPLHPIFKSNLWPHRDADLRQLVEDGATATEAAHAIGTTKNTVIGRAYRLGLVWARSPKPAQESRPTTTLPDLGCCAWLHGNPGDARASWCGERSERGRSFCPEHHRIAFHAAPAMKEAA
jgi:hypothetical protein